MNSVNNKTGDTQFHQIVRQGLEETRIFCESSEFTKSILEVSNNLKQRPLHIAVASQDNALVLYLLQKGAEVDSFKKGDWTSLMVSCTLSGPKAHLTTKILLDAGANAELKNKDGWTALHLASKTGQPDTVQLLVNHCPSLVLIASKNGRLPLHIAALNCHLAVVRVLIKAGGTDTVLSHDVCGTTPVLDAATGGNTEMLKFFSSLTDLKWHRDKRGF
ncbi:ankyrin repeat domain-containing protein 16-like isoform X2 [Neocloeon triangulifer]|nr:ankyrin repeat domain-containing protein 16-like isoform X2 [Neocloeon triangulifer]